MRRINGLDYLAIILLIIGGLNWGLVGLFNTDLVASIFGPLSAFSRVIYVLVGLAAVYTIFTSTKLSSVNREMGKREREYRST